LAPLLRASLSPIAIACLRLVTFFPERPERSLPAFISSMDFLTFLPAFGPYLRVAFFRVAFFRVAFFRVVVLRVEVFFRAVVFFRVVFFRVVFLRTAMLDILPARVRAKRASIARRNGYVMMVMKNDPRNGEWAFASSNACRAIEASHGFIEHLRASGDRHADLDAAKLIFVELVANVMRHAPGPIWIGMSWTREHQAQLCVRDSGDGFTPVFALPRDRFSESGRGLSIVASLADTVTVSRDEAGTMVCATLPVRLAA
jgi:anti-sigma regulatory factor (Ser/Thr protein kinase)